MANKQTREDLEEMFDKYVEEQEIDFEDEEAVRIELLGTYSAWGTIKNILNRIRDKEVEGYGHIADVDISRLGNKYFNLNIPERYEEIEADLRELGGSVKHIAKRLGVGRETVNKWSRVDSVLKRHIEQGRGNADKIVENRLFKLCQEENFNAIRFYLTNRASDKWKNLSSMQTDINVNKETALDKELDNLGEEELLLLFNKLTDKID